jgi:serine/threonine-protein phosphatase PGAM5
MLCIAKGNVIRYFVMRALQLPPEAWLRTAVCNGSITVLQIYPNGKVSLYSMGDVGYMPPDMITYN